MLEPNDQKSLLQCPFADNIKAPLLKEKKDILDKYTVVVRMGRNKLPIKPNAAGIEDKVWGVIGLGIEGGSFKRKLTLL